MAPTGATLNGLDVLAAEGFASLKGKRVGLITNATGIDRRGRRNVDLMLAGGVKVTALFSPEHGLAAKEDREGIGDGKDAATGLPIFSLYGETKRPSPESLKGLDLLVFDIADLGVRFYTYETTMAFGMKAAAGAKIPFVVLDRPNPIGGVRVEGPLLQKGNESFAGYMPGVPARHGMTMGELARFFNGEKGIGADLRVVPVRGWRRAMLFDETGLPWVDPSPNIRSLKAALLYPGVCLVEFARNVSVGRGTDAPFEWVGADWLDGIALAADLNARKLPGLSFYPVRFTPTESRFKGVEIGGVRIEITDRACVEAVRLGIELACALERQAPGKVAWAEGKRLIGTDDAVRRIAAGEGADAIMRSLEPDLRAFRARRERYMIYPR